MQMYPYNQADPQEEDQDQRLKRLLLDSVEGLAHDQATSIRPNFGSFRPRRSKSEYALEALKGLGIRF